VVQSHKAITPELSIVQEQEGQSLRFLNVRNREKLGRCPALGISHVAGNHSKRDKRGGAGGETALKRSRGEPLRKPLRGRQRQKPHKAYAQGGGRNLKSKTKKGLTENIHDDRGVG